MTFRNHQPSPQALTGRFHWIPYAMTAFGVLVTLVQVTGIFLTLASAADSGASESGLGSNSSDIEYYDTLTIEGHAAVDSIANEVTNANFVKTYVVTAIGETDDAISKISLDLPGQAIVSYIDFEEAGNYVNASSLAMISIYADSAALAEQIRVISLSQDGPSSISVYFPTLSEDELVMTGYLLVEVSVFRRNQVHTIRAEPIKEVGFFTSLEVVVNDGVLFSKVDKFIANGGGFNTEDEVRITVKQEAAVYVLSNSTALNVYQLHGFLKGDANLYLDAAAITATSSVWLDTTGNGTIVAITKSLKTDYLNLDGTGTTCVFVTDTFEVELDSIVYKDSVSLPGVNPGIDVKGAFTCSKAVIPKRAARNINIEEVSFTASNETLEPSSSGSSVESATVVVQPTSFVVTVAAVVVSLLVYEM